SPRSRSASTTTSAPLRTNLVGAGIAATVLPDAKRPRRSGAVTRSRSSRSGERLAATAGALRVRVVDREARALEAVLVVERRAHEVLRARGVDDHLDVAVAVRLDDVVGRLLGVEEHLVREARAAAGPHRDPQVQLGLALG